MSHARGGSPHEESSDSDDAFVKLETRPEHRRCAVPAHYAEGATSKSCSESLKFSSISFGDDNNSIHSAGSNKPPMFRADETVTGNDAKMWDGSSLREEGVAHHMKPPTEKEEFLGSPFNLVSEPKLMTASQDPPSTETKDSSMFWSPFGDYGCQILRAEASEPYDGGRWSPSNPCVMALPIMFRLEQSNFLVRSSSFNKNDNQGSACLSIKNFMPALKAIVEETELDVLELRPAHCLLECSYHKGNRFLSIFIRVFSAPDQASGQLLINENDSGDENQGAFLVEAQLREGDRLCYSALFKKLANNFNNQEGMSVGGTYRYHTRPNPTSEGLVLEEMNLAERVKGKAGGAASAPLLTFPPETDKKLEELDDDAKKDVAQFAEMLQEKYLDVQANSATLVAGLTSGPKLVRQLSMKGASEVARQLASASARLLVETSYRPARRQAAVIVANLSTTPELRAALLSFDSYPRRLPSPSRETTSIQNCSIGLVDALVSLAFDDGRIQRVAGVEGSEPPNKEEEIGTRRECMRALVGLTKCSELRNLPAMQLLMTSTPNGRGAIDIILRTHLETCIEDLKRKIISEGS